ncbi:hypothetical protein PMAYCL1PPCAC_25480, partial [Pristionchus mayeri]
RVEVLADPGMFAAPNNRSDVVLKIGEKKLHVSKELLSIHSPVFEAMFFGEFAEKDKEEVEIKDVVYEEFVDLLKVIYPGHSPFTISNVSHVLKLSDRFQMKGVIEHCVIYLQNMTKFNIMKKLLLAEQYNLQKLKVGALFYLTKDFRTIVSTPSNDGYKKLSNATKAMMCDRIMHLV